MVEVIENGIFSIDIRKFEIVKFMMYMLGIVLWRDGFLMMVILSKRLLKKDMKLIKNKKNDFIIWIVLEWCCNWWVKFLSEDNVVFMVFFKWKNRKLFFGCVSLMLLFLSIMFLKL